MSTKIKASEAVANSTAAAQGESAEVGGEETMTNSAATAQVGGAKTLTNSIAAAQGGGEETLTNSTAAAQVGGAETVTNSSAAAQGGREETMTNSSAAAQVGGEETVTNSSATAQGGGAETVTNSAAAAQGGGEETLTNSTAAAQGGREETMTNSSAAAQGGREETMTNSSAAAQGGREETVTNSSAAAQGGSTQGTAEDAHTTSSSTATKDPRKRHELTTEAKNLVAQFLLKNCINGQIRNGAQKEAAMKYGICMRTVGNIWRRTKLQTAQGIPINHISNKKGLKRAHKKVLDIERVEALTVLQRTSIRKMASNLGMSKSQMGRYVTEKLIRPHTNAIKPQLTEANKIARLQFCLSNLLPRGCNDDSGVRFHPMDNVIHIDEKWFFISKATSRYYLTPNEADPYRHCKSKRFITKVMFLCAVAKPQFGIDGSLEWDGKIDIFPFTTQEPAERSSKNRLKGTLETKAVQHVTKAVIKDCLIKKVVPAIKAKWPSTRTKSIIIQQDNAKPHLKVQDEEFTAAANSDGFQISLHFQPSNSPGCNVLDLGFFRVIQSLQTDKYSSNVEQLLHNVITSYEEQPADSLRKVFLTLQSCMIEIMKVKGGNNYKIPHMNKAKLQSLGQLPTSLEVDEEIVRSSLEHLQQQGSTLGSNYEFQSLCRQFGF